MKSEPAPDYVWRVAKAELRLIVWCRRCSRQIEPDSIELAERFWCPDFGLAQEALALINVADSHPLIVPRVRHYLTDVLKVSDDQRLAWIQH